MSMPLDPSFDELLRRLRAGDEDAAREVFQRFARRLIGLARQRLDRLVRTKVEAEDVVQSALKSFFVGYAGGEFELGDWNSLLGLLVVITLRKCAREAKRFRGPHHDVRREVELPADGEEVADWEVFAHEPTPAEAAMLADTVEQLLRDLEPRARGVLELRMQGYTVPEISAQAGLTEHTVEGVLRKVRKRLRRLEGGAAGAP
jgi:RNA polymerase sigma-70 factor (ECF subfamily)